MVNGRAKGHSFERDVRNRLRDALGSDFRRVLDQWAEPGLPDLVCDDTDFPFVIECKRYQKTSAFADPAWWDQVCVAAQKAGKLPALVYKGDRLQERWRVPVEAIAGLNGYNAAGDKAETYSWAYAVEMSFDDFCMLCREMMCD